MRSVSELFGNIDIYLFDQLQRGRIQPGMTVVDAGCGTGRNLVYFLRSGYEVFGTDHDPGAVAAVRQLARSLNPAISVENFRTEPVERMSFPDGIADCVISSAVLHFARDDAHFEAMLHGTWRVLKPGGIFFCRLASSIGMERRMPSDFYLVDEASLMQHTEALGAELLDPLKTTVVQNLRCMTTWVLHKPGGA